MFRQQLLNDYVLKKTPEDVLGIFIPAMQMMPTLQWCDKIGQM
jgi:hypothetical protein